MKGDDTMYRKDRSLSWLDKCDRTSTNEDGSKFFGFDDEETGKTTWYDEDGNLDCETPIPNDWDMWFSL